MESRDLLRCLRLVVLAALGPAGWGQSAPPVVIAAAGGAATAGVAAKPAKNPWRKYESEVQ